VYKLTTDSTQKISISNLQAGEVCNYRIETDCEGIVFQPDQASSSKVNVTWIEFEDDDVEFISSSNKDNNNMPSREQKFIYYYYTPFELYSFWENKQIFPDFEDMAKTPRKGQYDFTQGGFKAFNNVYQLASGSNPTMEIFDEEHCKRRSVYVTVTALETVSTSLDVQVKYINSAKIGQAALGLILSTGILMNFI